MASGLVCRANRPNTWLHRPACKREEKPCQLGAVHTWHKADAEGRVLVCPLSEQSGRDEPPTLQIPKSSLSVRAVEAIDCALARSSALFFGEEKPWPVPL